MEKVKIGTECKFVVHIPAKSAEQDDYHMVKERIHYSDGTTEPNIRYIKNYKRPFWVTKKGHRACTIKKSTEEVKNTDVYYSTQSELRFSVARALDEGWKSAQLRELANSPYVYGLDTDASVYISKLYQDKYPDLFSQYSVATFDIETDVIGDVDVTIMASLAMGNKIYTVVKSDFVSGFARPTELIDKAMNKYLGKYVDSMKLECVTEYVENEIDIWIKIFNKAHEWQPDFITIWNMEFEIKKFHEACERAKVDPASIMSDPSVPVNRRFYRFKEGPSKKMSAGGKVTPINVQNRWHTVFAPSSFYIIDAMCVYRQIRASKQEEQSYSLDSILDKELGIEKLKFKEAEKYQKLALHEFMQANYKIEYIIYNRFDVLSMLLLDDRTLDCKIRFPKSAGYTNYAKYTSQPYKACMRYNFYLMDIGYVLGSTGTEMKNEFDDETLGLKGWIITLKSHLQASGGNLIAESGDISTNVRTGVYDIDVEGAYPSAECAANSSVETTINEVISIRGVDEETFRRRNMEIASYPKANALLYCVDMMNFPTLTDWTTFYDNR